MSVQSMEDMGEDFDLNSNLFVKRKNLKQRNPGDCKNALQMCLAVFRGEHGVFS